MPGHIMDYKICFLLLLTPFFLCVSGQGDTLMCFTCSNYNGNVYNTNCQINATAGYIRAAKNECDGQCFTRQDPSDSKVGIRGCTSSLANLPDPLPAGGCYDWEGTTICICGMPFCNMEALGVSSGVAFDAHIKPKEEEKEEESSAPTIQCMTCSNYVNGVYNDKCPKNATANYIQAGKGECNAQCFTRQDPNDAKVVIRGCTSSLTNLPDPLPAGGCYEWEGATICICNMPFCNLVALGVSSGVAFDANLKPKEEEKEETPGPTIQCFTCSNYVDDEYNDKCPKDSVANYIQATKGNCNAQCFTRQDPNDEKVVIRGCVTSLTGLPDPLPAADCYDWEGAPFCICENGFCNMAALGRSTSVSLDAHLKPQEEEYATECFQCKNFVNGIANEGCPADKIADLRNTPLIGCNDKCFTRRDPNDENVVERGCTTSLSGLPAEFPPNGCYDWEGTTFCICSMEHCNLLPIGQSTGASLDPRVTVPGGDKTTAKPDSGGNAGGTQSPVVMKCYKCSNYNGEDYNTDCRENKVINLLKTPSVDCDSKCFTRQDPDNKDLVTRGCISSLEKEGLPDDLPFDGCYDWKGATFCVCSTRYCNLVAIGISTGIPLGEEGTGTGTGTGVVTVKSMCYQCSNYVGDKYYEMCPKNASVDVAIAYSDDCDGACFTRENPNDKKVVVRGCTSFLGTLPNPLPKDGCYDWDDATFCVCTKPYCNRSPLGASSGVSLDAHLADLPIEDIPDDGGPLQCFQCLNYNEEGDYFTQCPKDSRVNPQTVYSGNCTGACFTRTYKDNPKKVGRGCTDSQYGLPHPLPEDGCYDWYGEVYCVCTTQRCNGAPLGTSSGIEFDAHLAAIQIEEDDGVMKCYQCVNYDSEGTYYPQCAKNGRVRNAYLGPCNGTCFTRSYDYDDRLVARGCSDSQPQMPNPLPPDGCYKYYSEVWCVCSTSRCNGEAIGVPLTDTEFDAHIVNDENGARRFDMTQLQRLFFLFLCFFTSYIFLQ